MAQLGDRARLFVSFDMLIGDAWSVQQLGAELAESYQDPARRRPPVEVSFRDYVLAEAALSETDAYRAADAYWDERAATMPGPPELPLARTRPTSTSPASRRAPRPCRRRPGTASSSAPRARE